MILVLRNGIWDREEPGDFCSSEQHVCILGVEELEQYSHFLPLDKTTIMECLRRNAFTFEHQKKIDYIGIIYLSHIDWNESGEKICICAGTNLLAFVHDNALQKKSVLFDILHTSEEGQKSMSGLFVAYLEKIINGHIEQHELIEDEIAALENAFLTEKKNIGPDKILVLQKRLLLYKRYYEQFQHVLDDIQETKCNLIDKENMRLFTLYVRRIERLFKNVLVLREYVTQVRESYEAETDISLNSIMRIFTVVTVIFLPLTLIVGWYGMNLRMPEYHWIWGYPLVIAISLAIVVFSIIFFKKNKWF